MVLGETDFCGCVFGLEEMEEMMEDAVSVLLNDWNGFVSNDREIERN